MSRNVTTTDGINFTIADVGEPWGEQESDLLFHLGNNATTSSATVTTINDIGDVTITSATDQQFLRFDSGTGNWVNETVAITGISNVVEDTSPQLGGTLDLNSNNVTGTGNITITGLMTTTSTVNGRTMSTDGAKLDGIAASATANPNAIDNVVEDTTPQLGGSLDVNGNSIVSTGNGNITLAPDGTGNIILDVHTFPNTDGSSGQMLTTNGAGNLTWTTPPGAGGGEANTASNVGTGGVGVFKQKTGTDLEFKKINAGSAKITITDDTGNNEVDVDFGSVAVSDLSDVDTTGVSDNDFLQFNSATGDWEPWTWTRTDFISGLIEAPQAKTYVIDQSAAHGYTIDTLIIKSAAGTCTAKLTIEGVDVTGISAVSVSSTEATGTASAANTVSTGDTVALVITSPSTVSDVSFTMKYSRGF